MIIAAAIGALALLAGDALAQDRPIETALIAANPTIAKRDGDELRLLPQDIVLRDVSCSDDQTDCGEHELDAIFADGRVAGVATSYYEGGDYVLYGRREIIAVGERPIASPDGRLLVAASSLDEVSDGGSGLSLVAVDDHGIRLIRRVAPDILAGYENLRWMGSGCVAFEASTFTSPGLYRDGIRSTWYLVEDAPEWRLTNERADACREQ